MNPQYHAFKVYGFAADASVVCPHCAVKRYGAEIMFVNHDIRDWEGNDITPLYSWVVDSDTDYCDDCHEALIDG